MKLKLILLVTLICMGSVPCLAQRFVTKDEYSKSIREAQAKGRNLPNRKNQSIKSRWNGVETSEEWTYISQPPGRIHFIHVKTVDGKSTRIEQINIDGVKYCKRDSRDWAISESYCIGGSGSGGPSNIITETFAKETVSFEGEKATLLTNSITYKNQYSKTADTDGPSYWETKYWLSSDGLILRYESRKGLASDPKPTSTIVERYEYDPKIKVEAPIK